MEEFETPAPRERNPLTHQKHRREVLWQITIPLGLGLLVILTMAILAAASTASQASHWADISLIWLITPTLLFTLITLAILAALIYGLVRLILVLPFYTYRLLNWLNLFGSRVKQLGNKAVEPVLRVQALGSSVKTLGRNIRRRS
jgi:hypothetical protein